MIFAGAKRENIIEPATIPPVALFFNESEAKQLELAQIPAAGRKLYTNPEKAAKKKVCPKASLLCCTACPAQEKQRRSCNSPGKPAGKYSVVDISQSKSMLFGESEKIIKRIFTDYRAYAKRSERIVLLKRGRCHNFKA